MYVQADSVDIRVARLQQRLGLTISPAGRQQQSQQQEGKASQHILQDGSGTAGQNDSLQGPVLVQCLVHPAHPCQDKCVFKTVHEAVMAACMLEWKASPGGGPEHCHVVRPNLHDVCKSCALLPQLLEARLGLKRYLEHASDVCNVMLPTWHQLGALVPPG